MAFIVADRVKETSTSTGTGPIALAGAMTGFSTFASRCAVGDTLYYAIQAVDGLGAPTGEWECGIGTYSAANTLTRTTVTSSSNSDAAVSLSAGAKQVFITMPAAQVKWARERLTAARTYYVRTDGSDSNTGLANTADGAFLTIQAAVMVVAALDINGYTTTIQVADGTYTGGVDLCNVLGARLPGDLTIKGNLTTPANVVVSTTSDDCFSSDAVSSAWDIKDLKMQTTTSGYCLVVQRGSYIRFGNVNFGSCASDHILAGDTSKVTSLSSYAISGGAVRHLRASIQSVVRTQGITCTLTGTPNFSTAFAAAEYGGSLLVTSVTYSGSATGARYTATLNGIIQTGTGNTAYLPGNAAHGTPTADGGIYK